MLSDKKILRPWSANIYMRIVQNLKKITGRVWRKRRIAALSQSVQARDFTIICQFCAGGLIYHDLGMQFLSPTINLAFDGPDFIKFCSDIPKYLNAELVEYPTDEVPYPVGRLEDVEIRFIHYKTFGEAKQKWEERSKRINYNKILVMATDRDGMDRAECMDAFDKLPYKKVMYTAKEHKEYPWSIYCPAFRKKHCVGVMTGYADFFGNKYYEKYMDMTEFLN